MKKILIVIEDTALAGSVQKSLSQGGFFTAVVGGLEDMIKFCRQHTPDSILIDVDFDEVKLWPSIHTVRALGNLANAPILGTSNANNPEILNKSKEFGLCGVIPKGTDPATLIKAFNRIMIETEQNLQTSSPSGLERLIQLSEEVNTVASHLKGNLGEFGTDGAELFGFIENSGCDIASKLASIGEADLADKELRHDFRNMIGSVTGFSELILMEPSLSETSQRGLTRLRECSKEFVELLDKQKAAVN